MENLILPHCKWSENKDRRFVAFDCGVANKDRICAKKSFSAILYENLSSFKVSNCHAKTGHSAAVRPFFIPPVFFPFPLFIALRSKNGDTSIFARRA